MGRSPAARSKRDGVGRTVFSSSAVACGRQQQFYFRYLYFLCSSFNLHLLPSHSQLLPHHSCLPLVLFRDLFLQQQFARTFVPLPSPSLHPQPALLAILRLQSPQSSKPVGSRELQAYRTLPKHVPENWPFLAILATHRIMGLFHRL